MKPKKPARKKVKPVKAWAHQNKLTGNLTWIGTPMMTRKYASIAIYNTERVVRVTITIED